MRPKSMVAAAIAMALLSGITPVGTGTAAKPKGKSTQSRSPADIAQKRAKQAAKLARRAARAGYKVPKP